MLYALTTTAQIQERRRDGRHRVLLSLLQPLFSSLQMEYVVARKEASETEHTKLSVHNRDRASGIAADCHGTLYEPVIYSPACSCTPQHR